MIQPPTPNTLWYPGKKLEGFGADQLSARAQQIAKNREELLGLLHDSPESEYELSLSELVEKSTPSVDDAAGNAKYEDVAAERETKKVVTGIKERNKLRRNSSSGFGSGSNGVLLNFYMPSSLQRSLTASRAGRAMTAPSPKVAVVDCDNR